LVFDLFEAIEKGRHDHGRRAQVHRRDAAGPSQVRSDRWLGYEEFAALTR